MLKNNFCLKVAASFAECYAICGRDGTKYQNFGHFQKKLFELNFVSNSDSVLIISQKEYVTLQTLSHF